MGYNILHPQVNQLIEESCILANRGEITNAFEKAKEAGRKERVLVRQREQLGVADQINLDLTYSVLFNLANRYTASGMYQEALNTYQAIVRNKMFAHAGQWVGKRFLPPIPENFINVYLSIHSNDYFSFSIVCWQNKQKKHENSVYERIFDCYWKMDQLNTFCLMIIATGS